PRAPRGQTPSQASSPQRVRRGTRSHRRQNSRDLRRRNAPARRHPDRLFHRPRSARGSARLRRRNSRRRRQSFALRHRVRRHGHRRLKAWNRVTPFRLEDTFMNTATARKSDASPASASITEGLANLAEAFQSRKVKVARITLKKDGQTYEHKLSDQPGIHRDIEGQFTDIEIVVSCLSPLNPELNAELQAITTTAATAAEHWTAPLTRPTLVEPHSTSPKMIGESPAMSELHAAIRRAARSVHVTLIIGESGTGKTTAASMIHEQSSRAGKPFVDINCAAFPETLIESELFGYEKGAFTGANATKKGLFEAADGGTLFLDEIGEMKLELQAKLLKAIEQQKIRRVGGTKDVQCDVRIIAASSRNLQDMVTEGKFREDLFYRLAVLEVPIAPLRDRREDIPGLIKDRLTYEQHLVSLPSPFTIE